MELKTIMPYIVEEKEAEYLLNLWEPMLSNWNLKEDAHEWEAFISKMMEIERACVEEGDQRPIVTLNKNFKESKVTIIKKNKAIWTYTLQPYGANNNWEIFKVDRY